MQEQLKAAAREFALGATRPSLPALIGTVVVAAGIFILCAVLITPEFLLTRTGQFVTKKTGDHYGPLTQRAVRIHDSPADDVDVVLIGDSMVYTVLQGIPALENSLRTRLHRPVTVHLLGAGNLSHWEQVVLTDYLRDRIHGVVVLEISPFNVAMGKSGIHDHLQPLRLALDSPALRDEAKRAKCPLPRPVGNYFVDHFPFFASRVDSLLALPTWYKAGMDTHKKPWTAKDWRRQGSRVSGWVRDYKREAPRNLAIYRRMIARLREKPGIVVAMLEGSENPQNGKLTGEKAMAEYHQDVLHFAQENDVPYWDPAADAKLKPEDYVDYAHVTSPRARSRYQHALVEHLASLLAEKSLAKGDAR